MPKLKMSKRSRSAVIGLACGALCALCVGAYVVQVNDQAQAAQADMLARYGGDQVDVCVAKRDILAGETILDGDIETRTWVATLLPANAVTDKKEAVGKQAGSMILAGEVVSTSRFGFDASEIDVPSGLVAVSVPARDVQAVGGALSAGMSTDVYAVGPSSTTMLASGVQVLATSMAGDSSSGSTSAWVTLAVKPDVVEELVAASENLQIYFALPSSEIDSGQNEPAFEDGSESDDEEDDAGESQQASPGSSSSAASLAETVKNLASKTTQE